MKTIITLDNSYFNIAKFTSIFFSEAEIDGETIVEMYGTYSTTSLNDLDYQSVNYLDSVLLSRFKNIDEYKYIRAKFDKFLQSEDNVFDLRIFNNQ